MAAEELKRHQSDSRSNFSLQLVECCMQGKCDQLDAINRANFTIQESNPGILDIRVTSKRPETPCRSDSIYKIENILRKICDVST
ncbi:hypothetical protein TcasGA2_TC016266 [Tribolium castaneum]|uniref:Uncharacterized protein n=1 Tax=Tribolium castaneum TaxID=7070 RepID=D6X2X0_TRICA|nr:hypothetical protein TcasGA2_TC016266 [Tribolium castaneum]